MIENDKIVYFINLAIENLEAIKTCFERDGFVAKSYVAEKANKAMTYVEFILNLLEAEENE